MLRGDSLDSLKGGSPAQPLFDISLLRSIGGCGAADPFAFLLDKRWYVFFEMMRASHPDAVIAAVSTEDFSTFQSHGEVLAPGYHLSFPHLFEHGGEIYMMPESKKQRRVDLFRAVEFPCRWEFCKTVLRGKYMDASILFYGGRYWLFAGWLSYWLRVFYASSPLGPWKPILQPVARIYNEANVRPGGKPVLWNEQIIRFAQDNRRYYGHQLKAMRVTTLNRFLFRETPMFSTPFLTPALRGWNDSAMHHLDLHPMEDRFIAFVDGASNSAT